MGKHLYFLLLVHELDAEILGRCTILSGNHPHSESVRLTLLPLAMVSLCDQWFSGDSLGPFQYFLMFAKVSLKVNGLFSGLYSELTEN